MLDSSAPVRLWISETAGKSGEVHVVETCPSRGPDSAYTGLTTPQRPRQLIREATGPRSFQWLFISLGQLLV